MTNIAIIDGSTVLFSIDGPTYQQGADFHNNSDISKIKPFNFSVGSALMTQILSNNPNAKLVLRYKYRYLGSAAWNPLPAENIGDYYTDQSKYGFVRSYPASSITGSNNICSEATYTITNPGTITLENATGVATLTWLENNQWKVTRIGNSSGEVRLKSTQPDGKFVQKTIKVGLLNGNIDGPTMLYTNYHSNNEQIFEIKTNAGETFQTISIFSDRPAAEIINLGSNKFKVRVPANWNFINSPYQDEIKVTAVVNTTDCQKTVSANIIILPNPNDTNPGEPGGPGGPVGPGD